jgi:hypothetical protein
MVFAQGDASSKFPLPSPAEALLLQVCLSENGEAAARWRAWTASNQTLRLALAGSGRLSRLLPLLHFSIVRNKLSVDAETVAVLRAAALWEERRASRVREIVAEVLSALGKTGAPVLFRGAALAESVYPKPGLRHSHDVDLLVRPEHLGSVKDALHACGVPVERASMKRGARAAFLHRAGVPICLHTSLYAAELSSPRTIVPHGVDIVIAGRAAKMVGTVDALLYVAGQLASGNLRDSLNWVTDIVLLERRLPPAKSEWEQFGEAAADANLAGTVRTMLTYLRREIGVEIPM